MADKTYEAGTLNLSVLGMSDSAVVSIERTVKALNSLSRSISAMEKVSYSTAGSKLEVFFSKVARATNSINTQNISNLALATKSLASLSKISKLQNLDYNKISTGFGNLTEAITPFINKVQEAETSLNSLYGILSKSSSKKIQGLLGTEKPSTPKSKNGLLNTAKWTSVIYLARRLGSAVYNIAEAGSDYSETLNLWQTAMGSNLDQATRFVNKMNEAYGISEKTLMNAQAIFKNMLGSLGQITDQSAYLISEGVTQMALDYASLYNVTFEQAFTKFQAALAGQVRPIRSVAGYDITENTIFQLYQSLGGEKTMRQLSRTEKQLLSIYAVFEQMDKSNALGDLSKTMGGFANQSRVAADNISEIRTWLGVLFTYILNESKIMVQVNAMLITAARYLKAVAVGLGAIQEFPNDLFGDTTTDINNASDAIDKLNGKLLDFDKFRSLKSPAEGMLDIDNKVLNALSQYNSTLNNAQLEARILSDQWLKSLGFTIDTNGQLQITGDKLDNIRSKIFAIINPLKNYDGKQGLVDLAISLDSLITLIVKAIPTLRLISQAARPVITLLIEATAAIVNILDKMGLLEEVVGTIIAFKITSRIFAIGKTLAEISSGFAVFTANASKVVATAKVFLTQTLPSMIRGLTATQVSLLGLTGAFFAFSFSRFLQTEMSSAKRVATIFFAIAGAITAAAVALKAFHMDWAGALSLAGIVAGSAFAVSSVTPDFYAQGASNIMGGTMFVAGENGRTEAVYNGDNGKSNVANVKQMEQAFFNALTRHARSNDGKIVVEAYLDGEKVYKNTTSHARKDGKVWANA